MAFKTLKRISLSLIFCFSVNHGLQAADAAKGEKIYTAKCIECHQADGLGSVDRQAPKLAGQFDWYIVSQLQLFKKGERKNPEMMPFLEGLTETDFADLGAYVAGMKK